MTENFILFEKIWRTKSPALSTLNYDQQLEYVEFSSINRILENAIAHKEDERMFKIQLEHMSGEYFSIEEELHTKRTFSIPIRSMAATILMVIAAVFAFKFYMIESSTSDILVMKTLSLTERGETESIEGLYNRKEYAAVLNYPSKDDETIFYKALAHVALSDYKKAEILFKSISDVTLLYETYYNLAVLYILEKDYSNALNIIQKAIIDENILDKKEFEKLKEKCHI